MTAVGRSFLPILEREGLPDRLLGEEDMEKLNRTVAPTSTSSKLLVVKTASDVSQKRDGSESRGI
jgi:hypothetical protein